MERRRIYIYTDLRTAGIAAVEPLQTNRCGVDTGFWHSLTAFLCFWTAARSRSRSKACCRAFVFLLFFLDMVRARQGTAGRPQGKLGESRR